MCLIPNDFRDGTISLYSSKTDDEKESTILTLRAIP
jgi:hypothetical protein